MPAVQRLTDQNAGGYAANPEKRRRANRQRYAALHAFTSWLKLLPCFDCGTSYPTDHMEFDHRDPTEKSCGISTMFGKPAEVLQLELMKCDVVCHGCHVIRTKKWRAAQRTSGLGD